MPNCRPPIPLCSGQLKSSNPSSVSTGSSPFGLGAPLPSSSSPSSSSSSSSSSFLAGIAPSQMLQPSLTRQQGESPNHWSQDADWNLTLPRFVQITDSLSHPNLICRCFFSPAQQPPYLHNGKGFSFQPLHNQCRSGRFSVHYCRPHWALSVCATCCTCRNGVTPELYNDYSLFDCFACCSSQFSGRIAPAGTCKAEK